MSTETYKLEWDKTGEKYFETGVKQCVLYLQDTDGEYPEGVAWNGVTSISESPSGAEATPLYANDATYLKLYGNEEYAATLEAYTYPDEFAECDGSASLANGVSIGQQPRKTFGLCFMTTIGNDTDGNDHGYKLNFIYGAKAAPSERAHATINDSPEAMTMSWSLSTTPVKVTGAKPTASLSIDSRKADKTKLEALLKIVYGFGSTAARMPLPDEIKTLMTATSGS